MCSICNDPAHDDLNDSLDDIFGPAAAPSDIEAAATFAAIGLAQPTHEAPKGQMTYEEPCPSCKGSGKFYSYTGRLVGNCFKCKGSGKAVFKTSPAERAKGAADREAAKRKQQQAITDAANKWVDGHKEEFTWMTKAAAGGFGFAMQMVETVFKYGHLTEKQLEAVRRCLTRDQLREQEKAEIVAKAPDITGDALTKIETAFATAIDYGIKFPKLRLDAFIFSLVRNGTNAGAIYVKSLERDDNDERTYLGKIVDGRFVRAMKCSEETQARIIAAAMDPEAAAKAYGRRTGTCSMCGRPLTNGESIDLGIGPICAGRFGW